MAAPYNTRFEEAFSKTRAWTNRAGQQNGHYGPGPRSAQKISLHNQQSSISSQSSFTSDESNTTDVTPLEDPGRAHPMSRSGGSYSGSSQPPTPTPNTSMPSRPVQGLKSLKLGSAGSRSAVYTSKQPSQSSASSSSPTADTSMTTVDSMSPVSSQPSEDALTDLLNHISGNSSSSTGSHKPRAAFQRSQSENGRDQYYTSQGTLYRSALSRHARNQSTDSAGSIPSDDNLAYSGRSRNTRSPPSQGQRRDLSHRNLEELPLDLIQSMVGQIEYLNLGFNRIQSLPRHFLTIGSTLRTLDLRANGISVFPSLICELGSLEALDLSRNKIEKLPDRPGKLKRLQILIVNRNRLRRLPSWISQMTNLTHLKIDHNPVEWPPRHIAHFPRPSSPAGSQMERSASETSMAAALSNSKSGASALEKDTVMQNWIRTMQDFMRDHDPEGPPSSSSDPTTQTLPAPAPSRPKLLSIKTSSPPSATPTVFPNLTHGRNASASGSALSHPTLRPELRSKKSLPDLRIGQSPSPSTSHFSGTISQANPEGGFPPLPSPSGAIVFNDLHNPKVRINASPDDSKSAPSERHSGAYFRRLSMLPANTASKSLPMPVLEMVDGIRGILFSLSQVYSALKHFVLFATQDRLPVALTKLLATADVAMGSLINALDRFDSSSRRRQCAEAAQVAREVFEACRGSIGVFSRLVGVLGLQLKMITSQSDTRYIRTLVLMLYGSLGEISVAWQSMAPHAAQVAQYLSNTSSVKALSPTSGSSHHLQPVIPPAASSTSTSLESGMPPSAPQKQNTLPIATSQPLNTRPSTEQLTARARRHAGSFSVEDVRLGAHLPPAMSPTTTNAALSVSPSASSPTSPDSAPEGNPSMLSAAGSMRPRPGAPALASLPIGQNSSGMPYMDLMATLEGQPPTPMAPMPPSLQQQNVHPTIPLHRSHPSSGRAVTKFETARPAHNRGLSRQAQPSPSPSTTGLMLPPRSASFSTSARPNSPYATRQADSDYFDIVEQTTTVVFSVCNMLVESLSESNARHATKSISDLLELCDMSIQAARRLTSSLENTKQAENGHNPEFLALSNQHLCDDSSVFSRAVMQTAKLATDLSPELGFSKPVREGLSQMAKSTYSLLALLAVTYGK